MSIKDLSYDAVLYVMEDDHATNTEVHVEQTEDGKYVMKYKITKYTPNEDGIWNGKVVSAESTTFDDPIQVTRALLNIAEL